MPETKRCDYEIGKALNSFKMEYGHDWTTHSTQRADDIEIKNIIGESLDASLEFNYYKEGKLGGPASVNVVVLGGKLCLDGEPIVSPFDDGEYIYMMLAKGSGRDAHLIVGKNGDFVVFINE